MNDEEEEEEEEDDDDDYGTKRRWWSDESPGMEEATDGGIWDELWIFKVINFTLISALNMHCVNF